MLEATDGPGSRQIKEKLMGSKRYIFSKKYSWNWLIQVAVGPNLDIFIIVLSFITDSFGVDLKVTSKFTDQTPSNQANAPLEKEKEADDLWNYSTNVQLVADTSGCMGHAMKLTANSEKDMI